jgi:hypothetical protein
VASPKICAIDDLRRNFGRITAADGDKAHHDDDGANPHIRVGHHTSLVCSHHRVLNESLGLQLVHRDLNGNVWQGAEKRVRECH